MKDIVFSFKFLHEIKKSSNYGKGSIKLTDAVFAGRFPQNEEQEKRCKDRFNVLNPFITQQSIKTPLIKNIFLKLKQFMIINYRVK